MNKLDLLEDCAHYPPALKYTDEPSENKKPLVEILFEFIESGNVVIVDVGAAILNDALWE